MPDETVTQTTAAPATESAPTQETASLPENLTGNDWFNALDTAFDKLEKGEAEKPAEEAAPEKKEEAAPEKKEEEPAKTETDDDAETKNMTPTAGAKFKEIKAEAKAARTEAAQAKARLAELEAKLAEVEKAPKPDAEESASLKEAIAAKETRLAELEKIVAVKDFESTAEYQETVVTPMAAILSVVERIAKKYDVPEKKLISILEESDIDAQGEQIAELAANFSERDRVSLYTLGDDYNAVLADREALRAKAAEGLKALEAARQAEEAKRSEEAKKSWNDATNRVWEKLQKSIPLPEDPAEAAKLTSETKAQIAATNFAQLTDDQKAYAAYAGSQLPRIVKMVSEKDAKIAELNEALKKFQTAEPGAAAGASTNAPVEDDLDFLSAIDRRFSSVGL